VHGFVRSRALKRTASPPTTTTTTATATNTKPQLLWSLSKLIEAGTPPPLSPGGAEWQRLCESYLEKAAAGGAGSDDVGKASSFFKDALASLAGRQCVSRQFAVRCLERLPPEGRERRR
jgi:hypothetical protein